MAQQFNFLDILFCWNTVKVDGPDTVIWTVSVVQMRIIRSGNYHGQDLFGRPVPEVYGVIVLLLRPDTIPPHR
jgi:hypothetical protein